MVPPSSAGPETGRWSRSRGGWVPRRDDEVESDPDFSVRRFDDTGEMRWSRPGEGQVVDQDPVEPDRSQGWRATDTGTWSTADPPDARLRREDRRRARSARREEPQPPPYEYDEPPVDPYATGAYRVSGYAEDQRRRDRYEDVREVERDDRYDDGYSRNAPAPGIYDDPGAAGIYGGDPGPSIYGGGDPGGFYDDSYAEPEPPPRRRSDADAATGRRDRAPARSVAMVGWTKDDDSGSTILGSLTSMLSWYAVPVLGYLVYALFLSDGAPQPGCVEQLGVTCVAPRDEALGSFVGALPGLGLAFVLSMMLVVILRWFTKEWRSLTIGFVASVVGAGVATLFFSVLNSA